MVKHIVMWNVCGDTAAEKAQGIDRLQRSFERRAALEACDSHPERLRVKQEVGGLRVAR